MDDQSQFPNQQPQQPPQQPNSAQEERPPKPISHLDLAILSTLFCCLPLGIVSIVYAAKVNDLYNAGDYAGAQDASDKAMKYAEWGAFAAIIFGLLYLLLSCLFGLSIK